MLATKVQSNGLSFQADWPFRGLVVKTVVMTLAIIALVTANVEAQEKYYPEHPEVQALADRAVKKLKGGPVGDSTIAALALVEHSKRYKQQVPRNHQLVKSTVERIRKMCAEDTIVNEVETYFPALALILLAEVDAERNHKQILHILGALKKRQQQTGAFTYKAQDGTGDCSQTQFAALAMWVAKSHNFNVDLEMAEKTLNWFCKVARQGKWAYMYNSQGRPTAGPTRSMNAAGLSSVYLMADMLQLNRRKKNMQSGGRQAEGLGLPETVSIYVKPVAGKVKRNDGGPLVSFDRGLLGSTINAGNNSFSSDFSYEYKAWNYYYVYAIERYAYFREQAEGSIGGRFENWYDEGVEFLKAKELKGGGYPGAHPKMSTSSASAFAILFLVRSSEIINLPPAESRSLGSKGFQDGTLKSEGGRIRSNSAAQNLSDMMGMLEEGESLSTAQLQAINASLKKQIVEFRNQDDKSRAEIKGFLRSMIGAKNYYRRLIAVRFLAGEQDMDNVPGLIYAVSDPDLKIALEAHQGLRLISRKIDSMKLSDETVENARRDIDVLKKEPELEARMRSEFRVMERKWSEWFLRIRPDAELFGQRDEPGS